MKFKTEVEISEEAISSELCSAFEQGIYYWAEIVDSHKPAKPYMIYDHPTAYTHQYPMRDDGWVDLKETEDADAETVRLDRAAIVRGLELMASEFPHVFGRILDQNGDAETGDILVQLAVFGEVRYG